MPLAFPCVVRVASNAAQIGALACASHIRTLPPLLPALPPPCTHSPLPTQRTPTHPTPTPHTRAAESSLAITILRTTIEDSTSGTTGAAEIDVVDGLIADSTIRNNYADALCGGVALHVSVPYGAG